MGRNAKELSPDKKEVIIRLKNDGLNMYLILSEISGCYKCLNRNKDTLSRHFRSRVGS